MPRVLNAKHFGKLGAHSSIIALKKQSRECADATFLALQFCADVPPGNARAKECLEDNREQPGFSPGCKEEVEKMMESRASDFRLDPKLRQLCADDIQVATSFAHLSAVGQRCG